MEEPVQGETMIHTDDGQVIGHLPLYHRQVSTSTHLHTLVSCHDHSIPATGSRFFHASSVRQDETKEVEPASSGFKWEPIYSVPLGIAFAVPALKYEWILVNEEMQVGKVIRLFVCV